jgi:hypothetical protein
LALFGVGGGEALVGGFAGGGGVRSGGEFDAVFGEFLRLQRQDAAFVGREVDGEGLGVRGALDLVEADLRGGEGFAGFEAVRFVFGIGDGVSLCGIKRQSIADEQRGGGIVAETGGSEPAVEQRDEFRAEGELAVARMPAGGEDDERAFADAGAEDGGMAVVEGGEGFEAGLAVLISMMRCFQKRSLVKSRSLGSAKGLSKGCSVLTSASMRYSSLVSAVTVRSRPVSVLSKVASAGTVTRNPPRSR